MGIEPSVRMWRQWVAVFLLAMAVAHTIVFWQQRTQIAAGYGDFSAFYTAGLMVRRGIADHLYDPQQQWRLQQEFASHVTIRQGPMPYIRPPFEALIFSSFALLPYPIALAAWSLLKALFLWLALKFLPRQPPYTRIYPPWFEAILCLGFFPVFLDFYQGQDAVLLLLLLVLALRKLLKNKNAAAGAILALGLFKFHLVAPVAIVVALARRPRVLAGFFPVAAVLAALCAAIAGVGVFHTYPAYLLNLNHAQGVGMVTAQSMTNLRGALTAFVGRSPYPGPIHWWLMALALGTWFCVVLIWRSSPTTGFENLALGYSLTLVVAIVTSYYAYSYDLTLLLIPVVLLGSRYPELAGPRTVSRAMILGGILLLLCAPLYWALILRLDRPYLLVFLLLLLGLGAGSALSAQPREVGRP